uniref:Uncharacterized protein n=1 Tax=Panagrolaimus davidi TaxID=227884 RepID=A0A914Q6B4_9BILA
MSTSMSSNRKRKANDSIMIQSKRFCSTYNARQNWSLPNSIIYYISKNPSTSKSFQKLIQSCKYFFIKNPIIIVPEFHVTQFSNEITCNIWITESLGIITDSPVSINKIYQCDATSITISGQRLSINELIAFASKSEMLHLSNAVNRVGGAPEIFKKPGAPAQARPIFAPGTKNC